MTACDHDVFQQDLSAHSLSRAPVGAHTRHAGSIRTLGLLYQLWHRGQQQVWALHIGSPCWCFPSPAQLRSAADSTGACPGTVTVRWQQGILPESSSFSPDRLLQVHCANLVVTGEQCGGLGLWVYRLFSQALLTSCQCLPHVCPSWQDMASGT